jgi:hypothetical protein
MPPQRTAGTKATGYVTNKQSPGPRECAHCQHFSRGNCNGAHVMADPELKDRRNEDGTVKVEPNSYCFWYEAK